MKLSHEIYEDRGHTCIALYIEGYIAGEQVFSSLPHHRTDGKYAEVKFPTKTVQLFGLEWVVTKKNDLVFYAYLDKAAEKISRLRGVFPVDVLDSIIAEIEMLLL